MKKGIRNLIIFAAAIVAAAICFACEETPGIYLRFYSDGAEYASVKVVGSNVEMPADPVKDGYVFEGWYVDDGIFLQKFDSANIYDMQAFSYKVYAKWRDSAASGANARTISFNTMGGQLLPDIYRNIGDVIIDAPAAVRNGYYFEGWSTTQSGADTVTFPYTVTATVTFYAKWTAAFIVKFNAYGGTEIPDLTVKRNSLVVRPADPSRTGNNFWAWYKEASYITQWNFEKDIVTSNLTLYARWENPETSPSNPEVMTVSGAYVTGTEINYTVSNSVTTLPLGDKIKVTTGCTWILARDDSGVNTVPSFAASDLNTGKNVFYVIVVSQNGTTRKLYVLNVYRNKLITLKLLRNYNSNDINEMQSQIVEEGQKPVYFSPSRGTGYEFGGWFFERVCINEFDFTTPVSAANETIVLYARWISEEYQIAFAYNGADSGNPANSIASTNVGFGLSYQWHIPYRRGYKFLGWFENSNGTGKQYTDGLGKSIDAWDIIGGKTAYAVWQTETYNITYNLNGGNFSATPASTFTVNSADIQLAEPVRTGYKFEGWYTTQNFSTAQLRTVYAGTVGHIDLFAKWSPLRYTIVYNLDGGTNNAYNPQYTDLNSVETTLLNPSKLGYNFGGWYSDAGLTVSDNIVPAGATEVLTYYAKWVLTEYTVNYNLSDDATNNPANPATVNIEINTNTLLLAPVRSGYVFDGWYQNAQHTGLKVTQIAKNPAGDVVIYPKWLPVTYTAFYRVETNVSVTLNRTSKQVVFGSIFTLDSATKDGSDFLGWYTQPDAQGERLTYGNGSSLKPWAIAQDTDVFPGFAERMYTVSLDCQGGSIEGGVTQAKVGHFATSFTLPVPVRKGYSFTGWYSSRNFTEGDRLTDNAGRSVAGRNIIYDIPAFAGWAVNSYTVTLKTLGGTIAQPQITVKFDQQSVNIGVPVKIDAAGGATVAFEGWQDIDGNAFAGADGKSTRNLTLINNQYLSLWDIDRDITLYANYVGMDYKPVASAAGLAAIGSSAEKLAGKYYLACDIDLTGVVWTPIGTENAPFTGILNGLGYAVRNLNINTAAPVAGLFGYSSGRINNLSVQDITISFTITDSVTIAFTAGAVAAHNSGRIYDVYTSGRIHIAAAGRQGNVGGIAGVNAGTIATSWTVMELSSVTGAGDSYVGGIAGTNLSGALISYTLSSAEHISADNSSGYISNNARYNTLSASGGVAGKSLGSINAYAYDGMFYRFTGDNFNYTYATTADLKNPAWYIETLMLDTRVWVVPVSGQSTKYPVFAGDSSEYLIPANAAIGTVGNPYQISTAAHFDQLRSNPHWSAIVTVAVTLDDVADWVPVGTPENPYTGTFTKLAAIISPVRISRLHITNSGTSPLEYAGLFGVNRGKISNIDVADATVSIAGGAINIGAVAGINAGIIENVFLSGSSVVCYYGTAAVDIGGIAGLNLGTIQNSRNISNGVLLSAHVSNAETSFYYSVYATVINNSAVYAGGIAGKNAGTISACFAGDNTSDAIETTGGNVFSSRFAGGLAGRNAENAIIINCYTSQNAVVAGGLNLSSIYSAAGGITATNNGIIRNVYTYSYLIKTYLTETGYVGGIAGEQGATGMIYNSLSINTEITASNAAVSGGNIVGFGSSANVVNSSYVDSLSNITSPNLAGSPAYSISLNANYFKDLFSNSGAWDYSYVSGSLNIYPLLK